MDDDQQPQTPAPADPDAPFGRRADGTAYKRDPSFFEHLRKPGTGRRTTRKTAPAKATGPATKPAERPAGTRKPGKPEYAKKLTELGKVGAGLIPDPVERLIATEHIPRLALAVERAALQSPTFAALLDKILLADLGGVWLELGLELAVPVGLVAMHRGVSHPMLSMMLGAQLQALTLRAVELAEQDRAREAQLRQLLHSEDQLVPAPVEQPVAAWGA